MLMSKYYLYEFILAILLKLLAIIISPLHQALIKMSNSNHSNS